MTETSQALDTILKNAPSGTKTYALMDCALDSTVHPAIQDSGCPNTCLYAESWQAGLANIAPHLLELTPRAKFSTTLLSWDWYGNWGVFVQSSADLATLASQFKAITMAKLPDGKEAFFRFFDPRVLRPFLANASSNDLNAVFDKATRYVVPMVDDGLMGEGAIVYTLDNGALAQTETRFDG